MTAINITTATAMTITITRMTTLSTITVKTITTITTPTITTRYLIEFELAVLLLRGWAVADQQL